MKTPIVCLVLAASGLLVGGPLARANRPGQPSPSVTLVAAATNQAIAWADLGAKATAQYSGDGLAITTAADGVVRLRCAFQKLEGEVTSEGLWLESTVSGTAANRFRVVADRVGREGGALLALPASGAASAKTGQARFVRPGLTEEYFVSVDGVRQDFLISEAPRGEGNLRLELTIAGASAELTTDGVRLKLESSRRQLAYHRLRVVDEKGRQLPARWETQSEHRLAVVVDDAGAAYPVRIDPTFSELQWRAMGGIGGCSGSVYAAVADGAGNLYVGGSFYAVGNTLATNIARWDGVEWSALGQGVNGTVRALALSGTELYVGGHFTAASGISANHIVKWDGNLWSPLGPLGSGTDGYVLAIAANGSEIYAGGYFSAAGGIAANGIAKWNGAAWSALGTGIVPGVWALAVMGGEVYAGGVFQEAGGVSANNVAKWNGSAWTPVGSGVDYEVRALAVGGSYLYAGGGLLVSEPLPEQGPAEGAVARWNGSAWMRIGGMNEFGVDPV